MKEGRRETWWGLSGWRWAAKESCPFWIHLAKHFVCINYFSMSGTGNGCDT